MTATIEETRIVTSTDKADSAHIVMVPKDEPDETPQAYVLRARVMGLPVTALCGHVWVPQKNPASLPVCEPCLSIYQQPGENRDDREELPDA